jgi:ABC-2 type transport system ATP-binding protein
MQDALQGLSKTVKVSRVDGNRYEVEAESDIRADAADAIVKAGGRLQGLNVEVQSLDDIYARYFKEAKHAPAN